MTRKSRMYYWLRRKNRVGGSLKKLYWKRLRGHYGEAAAIETAEHLIARGVKVPKWAAKSIRVVS